MGRPYRLTRFPLQDFPRAKPLNQDEIDMLLQGRNQLGESGEAYDFDTIESIMAADSERRVNSYNFKRPRLFAQAQMRVLNHVHETFARELPVYLSAQLRTIVRSEERRVGNEGRRRWELEYH